MESEQLFLRYFEVFIQWRALRDELDRATKDGFWELSRARIQTLTNQQACSITPLQYDMGMKSQLTIVSQQGDDGLPELTLQRSDTTVQKAGEQSDSDATSKAASSTPSGQREGRKAPADPVQWFGFFPPKSLRDSQKHFKSALALSVQLASLQRQMSELQHRYHSVARSS